MLDKVEKFVTESFGKENQHLVRTLYWIKELKADASEELLIAAVSHDIERAFNTEARDKKTFNTDEEMEIHQVEGGRIMFDFLIDNSYDAAKAARVRELISKHEVGGDEEQDLLKDADSISWLEMSAPKHIGKQSFPKEELEKKVASMFQRISSSEAKEFAQPFYEEAVKMLGEMQGE
jgi:hypothetical protein